MKKLKNLNLRQLGQAELSKKEMNALTGGYGYDLYGGELPTVYVCGCKCNCPTAGCTCKYAGPQEGPDDPYYGGSSIEDNRSASGGQASWNTADSSGNVPTV